MKIIDEIQKKIKRKWEKSGGHGSFRPFFIYRIVGVRGTEQSAGIPAGGLLTLASV